MSRPAFLWTTGGIVAIVAITVFANPFAGIVGMLASGLLIEWLDRRDR